MTNKLFLQIILITIIPASLLAQNQFYLSSSLGNDNNPGTENLPWKSLQKISNTSLGPGDTVYFKRGDAFYGHFAVDGSGTLENPITFTAYGPGDIQPIISGSGHEDGGGDYREAILVNNNDNMIFEDLEIQNHRTITRTGVGDLVSFGIQLLNDSNSVMHNFTFRKMTFRNVYGLSWVDPSNQDAFNDFEVSGLTFKSSWGGHINNVLVEDSYFTDLQRIGIHIKNTSSKSSSKRNTNFVVRRNEFFQIGGTCVLPIRTENCLIENNIFNQPGAKTNEKMIGRGSAVWNWYSINTIIQYNQTINAKGIMDSHGIHVDHGNIDTFIQYNYMQDCEGGFVEILGGNEHAVYRFNISLNDGWRVNPNWINSDHTIWLNNKIGGADGHESNNSYIYNNTIVINKSGDDAFETAIDIKATNTRIFNNIFYAINGSGIGTQQLINQDPNLLMTHNLFYGNVRGGFKNLDNAHITSDPTFSNESLGNQYGFQINASSPAVNAGRTFTDNYAHPPIPVADSPIFNSVEAIPSVDFFGHNLSSVGTPNVGASNAKNGELLSLNNDIKKNISIQNPILSDQIVLFDIDTTYNYKLVDLLGRTQQHGKVDPKQSVILLDKSFSSGIYLLKLENELESYSGKLVVN